MYLTKQMNSFYMYFVRCGFMTVHRIKTSPGVSIKTCMMKINFHQTDISLIQFHFSAMTSVYLLCSLHQPWFIFCFLWHLSWNLLYSWMEVPHLPSWRPPLSLSLLSSYSPCLIGSVISPHSAWCLLIWQRDCLPVRCCCLYCLLSHLMNSSKRKRKGMGENSWKSCGFAQLTV